MIGIQEVVDYVLAHKIELDRAALKAAEIQKKLDEATGQIAELKKTLVAESIRANAAEDALKAEAQSRTPLPAAVEGAIDQVASIEVSSTTRPLRSAK